MIDCPNGEIRDLLPDLLHHRLSESEGMRVQRHVDACAACSAELELLRDLRDTLRRAPAIDVAAITAAIPAYRAPVRRAWGGWRAAAAIAAVVVGATSIALLGRDDARTAVTQVAEAPASGDTVLRAGGPVSVPSSVSHEAETTSVRRSPPPAAAPIADPQALAMSGGAIGELTDGELATLLDEIETLDALPSEDVDGTAGFSESIPLEGAQ